MATLAGLPYVALRFKKDGTRATSGPIWPSGVTDLIVISHGWHQDPDDAEAMYTQMLTHLQAQAGSRLAGRTLGVTGVYWPSDQFRDDLSQESVAVLGSAAAAAVAGGDDADLEKLKTRARDLAHLFDMAPDRLEGLVTYAATGGAGDADALVEALRAAMGPPGEVDAEMQAEHAELLDPAVAGREIVQSLKSAGARGAAAAASGGQAAAALGFGGAAASSLGFLSGPVAAVATLLNQAAYFNLKKRAGIVGVALGKLVDAAGLADGQRLHLVGHSFGARLVTAATSTMTKVKPYSLTMLQGAFSHNGLGVDIKPGLNGAFRNVVADAKVAGRIAITHTWNDHAVGVAYAIASRASNEVAAGFIGVTDHFGGAKDIFGGMGANGALRLKDGEGVRLVLDGQTVPALGAGVSNLKCDFIKSHSDIRTPEVARVLLAAMA